MLRDQQLIKIRFTGLSITKRCKNSHSQGIEVQFDIVINRKTKA